MSNNFFRLFNKPLQNPLSTNEQEKYLILAQKGNGEAKEILFKHNLKLVIFVINNYFSSQKVDKDDLFQVGCIELWNAISNFDSTVNNNLSTYAVKLIWGGMKNYINQKNDTLRIPRDLQYLYVQIIKYKNSYNVNKLDTKKIAELLNIDEIKVNQALNSKQSVLSLSSPVDEICDTNSGIYLEDTIEDTAFSIDNIIEKIDLEEAINKLNEKEKVVIKSLYGIGTTVKTQLEVAKILNTAQSNVSRIKFQAINKLRILLNNYENDQANQKIKQIKCVNNTNK